MELGEGEARNGRTKLNPWMCLYCSMYEICVEENFPHTCSPLMLVSSTYIVRFDWHIYCRDKCSNLHKRKQIVITALFIKVHIWIASVKYTEISCDNIWHYIDIILD